MATSPNTDSVPFAANAVRLSPREWLVALAILVPVFRYCSPA